MTVLSSQLLDVLLTEHKTVTLPRLERLWDYYRNPMHTLSEAEIRGRWYSLGQEQGLPRRFQNSERPSDQSPREVVIENDIAWRIHALVDFMFGKGVTIQSTAADATRATIIERFLRDVFDRAGGAQFFQDLALLGAVYGYTDVLVRVSPTGDASRAAEAFSLDLVEAPRAVPLLRCDDYRQLDAYVVHYRRLTHEVESGGLFTRLRRRMVGCEPARRASVTSTEVWTARQVERFEEDDSGKRRLIERSANALGRIPVVHIQNLPQPFFYDGLSEVEPLIPLQDELNIRLSDRANRVTFQSFKMYLGKGIEGFNDKPVGPGQMWSTENERATIEEFGGDANSPSEESHIAQIREAMDKTSAVTALAAGLIQNRLGNLTSENALRVTMMGLLARTEKKRVTYGAGIQRLCELLLHAADTAGILRNSPDERGIRIDWPSPLPEDSGQRLRDAKLKLDIGISPRQVLTELGYHDLNPSPESPRPSEASAETPRAEHAQ